MPWSPMSLLQQVLRLPLRLSSCAEDWSNRFHRGDFDTIYRNDWMNPFPIQFATIHQTPPEAWFKGGIFKGLCLFVRLLLSKGFTFGRFRSANQVLRLQNLSKWTGACKMPILYTFSRIKPIVWLNYSLELPQMPHGVCNHQERSHNRLLTSLGISQHCAKWAF